MKILIAVDGSKPSLHATKFAIALLSKMDSSKASITLISVHDDAGLRHAKSFVGAEAVADYLHIESGKDLKDSVKEVESSGVRWHTEIKTGHVAQEIVDFAKAGKFDLIVLGSKGRGAISDLLIGSVASRVLAMANEPVVIVK